MKNLILINFILFLISTASIAQNIFNVKDYGADPTGKITSTAAIQAAIDACDRNGGGMVYFAPGNYVSGQIQLKSNINLYLEAGAILIASRNIEDYEVKTDNPADNQNIARMQVLIYGEGLKNITISGKGTIHGNAEREWADLRSIDTFIEKEIANAKESGIEMKRAYIIPPNPKLVVLNNCENVLIENVSVIESPHWSVHIGHCNHVIIKGVYIYTSLTEGVNADGIDVDACKNVHISDCTIITGDDAICLKSTWNDGNVGNCENITVTNCSLTSTSAALKIGTETFGDFRNIVFSNCVITDSNRGLGIIVRDGATVSNVVFSNIAIETNRKHFNWWGDGDPIFFTILKRNEDSKVGTIREVIIENIIAKGQGTSKILGFPGRNLENITLKNVSISIQAEGKPDKRADDIIYANGVDNLKLIDVEARFDPSNGTEPKWRHAVNLENINRLRLSGFAGSSSPKGNYAVVKLNNAYGPNIYNNISLDKNQLLLDTSKAGKSKK